MAMTMRTTVASALPDIQIHSHQLNVKATALNLSYSLLSSSPVCRKRNIRIGVCRRFLYSVANQHRKSVPTSCLLSDGTALGVEMVTVNDPLLEVKKKAMDVAPDLKGTSIFLVGMTNSLKTKLGKLLADVLRYYYFDSDSLVVEAGGGLAAAKLYKESDENSFQEAETEVLKQLSSMGRLVVCAGNGAVQSSTNLALLRHGISFWIDVPLETIANELVEDDGQLPVFDVSTSGSYSEVLNQVTSLYQKIKDRYATADATISLQNVASKFGYDDPNTVTTEDMALEVLKEIEKLTRVKKMIEAAGKPF